MQLDLLLRSMKKYFKEYLNYPIKVLFDFSDVNYKIGYEKLQELHPEVFFVKETFFKSDLLTMIDISKKYTIFLVDDIIFKDHFSLECKEIDLFEKSDDVICVSLRLHPKLTYCYARDIKINKNPILENCAYTFEKTSGDYSYPMSLDGHIFKTNDIYKILVNSNYIKPNSLEGELNTNYRQIKKSKIICFEKSVLFNNPINRVQTEVCNKSGNISSTIDLNIKFLNDKIIDLDYFDGFENNSVHQLVEVKIVNRG
jgi:hypothetical protein